MQAGNVVNSFPGWGGATTTNPQLARVTVKKSDCSGNPHEPWEKSTIGKCPRSTAASRKTPPSAVPVPGVAGYQMTVASGRGWPVVLDVRVHVMVVAPTVNGPGPVTSARACARVGASSARAVSQCGIRIPEAYIAGRPSRRSEPHRARGPWPLARLVPTGGPTLLRGVQRPLSLHALEAMDAVLHEAQARSRDQILQSAGDQHLARVRRGGHAGADVHGDAAHVVAPQLALAGVQAGADLEAERAHRLADGQRTAHRACGTVEGREEAVARRVNLPAAEAAQLLAYGGVVPLEQIAPGAVAEPRGVLRGAHDVGEQHRGQHAVVVDHRARPGEELLDRCEHRLHVPGIEEVVVSRQLHELGTSDVLGKVAAVAHADVAVAGAVQHEGRHADGLEDRPDVGVQGHGILTRKLRRAHRQSLEPGSPAPGGLA